MKKLILRLRDKTKVHNLAEFCHVVFVSKFTNTVTIEISESRIHKLDLDPNIVSYRECDEGKFQPRNVAAK